MKNITELITSDLSAKKEIEDFIAQSPSKTVFENSVKEKADEVLVNLQVTTNSYLGAIVHTYKHLIVQNGLIRFICSGDECSRNIIEWNKLFPDIKSLIFANDVFGGLFAINYGDLDGSLGEVNYFSPLELEWYSLSCSHSDFVGWSFVGEVLDFYEYFHIQSYEKKIIKIPETKGLLVFPYLWTKEFQDNKGTSKEIPIEELVALNFEWKKNISNSVQ